MAAKLLLIPLGALAAPTGDEAATALRAGVTTDRQIHARTTLSPAEIRNAVTVRLDRLAWRGVAVDRAVYDGIGLDQSSTAPGFARLAKAQIMPAPVLVPAP